MKRCGAHLDEANATTGRTSNEALAAGGSVQPNRRRISKHKRTRGSPTFARVLDVRERLLSLRRAKPRHTRSLVLTPASDSCASAVLAL